MIKKYFLKIRRLFLLGKNNPNKTIFVGVFFWFFCAVSLHIIAMMIFEDLNFFDSIWLTTTTLATVGYGDYFAKTTYGKLSTILLIYIFGIILLSNLVSKILQYREHVGMLKKNGYGRWKMNNHIIIIHNSSNKCGDYPYRVVKEFRKSETQMNNKGIILISTSFTEGLPSSLTALNVNLISGNPVEEDTLVRANITEAYVVVILSDDPTDLTSDSINFDIATYIHEKYPNKRLIVEILQDSYMSRLEKFGIKHSLKPMPYYPEFLAKTINNPGVEKVMVGVIKNNDLDFIAYHCNFTGLWIDLVTTLLINDIGTAIAFRDTNNEIINNPRANDIVTLITIFTLSDTDRLKSHEQVKKIVSQITKS